jgi:co-chaperonin GroES (HSP10)
MNDNATLKVSERLVLSKYHGEDQTVDPFEVIIIEDGKIISHVTPTGVVNGNH